MNAANKKIKAIAILAMVATSSLVGCSHADRGKPQSSLRGNGGIDGGGLANPASEYCVKSGGQFELYLTQRGEIGFCKLGRAQIEEWTLYRYKKDSPRVLSAAVKAFLNSDRTEIEVGPGGANPASVYCDKIGGKSVIYDSTLGQTGACEFEDNSTIEEWTLFRGINDPENNKLTGLLKG